MSAWTLAPRSAIAQGTPYDAATGAPGAGPMRVPPAWGQMGSIQAIVSWHQEDVSCRLGAREFEADCRPGQGARRAQIDGGLAEVH
jgi:hypothetical protein